MKQLKTSHYDNANSYLMAVWMLSGPWYLGKNKTKFFFRNTKCAKSPFDCHYLSPNEAKNGKYKNCFIH